MSTSMGVGGRTVAATGVALAALVAAYLLGGGWVDRPARAALPAAVAPAPAPDRTVTVSGRGEVRAVPDRLGFRVEASATRPRLADALATSGRALRRALAAMAPYGVRRGDVRTTGLSMDPVSDYPRYGPPTLRGYRVAQRAAVLVRDLAHGGAAIGAAVAAGGDRVRVDGIRLEIGHPAAALARARDAAVADARARAERYAAASGQELGAVLTLREVGRGGGGKGPESPVAMRGALDAAAPLVPVRPGRTDVGVDVQVVWELGGPGRRP